MSLWRVCLAATLILLFIPAAGWAEAPEPVVVRGLSEAGRVEQDIQPVYKARVALVVGIDNYDEPSLRLRSARKGAEAVAAVLASDFGFDEVLTLYDGEATRDGVLSALAGLRRLEPDDALLIYWAGHGATLHTSDQEELGFLVPADGALGGDRALVDNISMEEIRSVVGLAIPARHKLLVVDACYGGLLTLRGAPTLPPEDRAWLRDEARRPVFQVLTAGESDQAVLDGGPGGHSVFTGRMLEVLAETTAYVTATELAVALQRRVRADAWARGSHEQTPAFGRISGTGDFVLLRTPGSENRAHTLLTQTAPVGPRRSRGLAVGAATSLAVGALGVVIAAVARSRYLSAPLSSGEPPGLIHLNRAAGAVGIIAVGAGAVSFGAAFVVAEW